MRVRRPAILTAVVFVSAFALAACGGSSGGPGKSAATPGGNPSGNTEKGCTVQIAGDLSTSWQSPQDSGSVLVSYWLSATERSSLSMAQGEESFLINCQSTAASGLSLYSTSGTTTAQFPKAAGQMVIGAGGILGSNEPGQVSLLFSSGDESLWRVSEAGRFTITTLSGSRFAGTFEAKIEKLGDDLQTVTGHATVTGTFDFSCTAGGCS
jgi:hypothetical protein